MTMGETHALTPYRSYFEITPYDTHYPIHTPHQSLFPEQTPFNTHYPDRTNHRSFPLYYIERTPHISSEQSNNSNDQSESKSLYEYSTAILSVILIFGIAYILGARSNTHNDS